MPSEIDLNAIGIPGHPGVTNQNELIGKEVKHIINQGALSITTAMKILEWFTVLTRLDVWPDQMLGAYLRTQPTVASRFDDEWRRVFGENEKAE